MDKILLVVDVSNLYYTVGPKFAGRRLDYRKLYDHVSLRGQILRAIAYGSELEGNARGFKEVLQKIGYETKFKEPKRWLRDKADGSEKRKADWDVGIAIDIVRIVNNVDYVVMVTADGDMSPVAQYVQERGKLVRVIGCNISHELRDCCNSWMEVDEDLLGEFPCKTAQSS